MQPPQHNGINYAGIVRFANVQFLSVVYLSIEWPGRSLQVGLESSAALAFLGDFGRP